MPIGRPGSGTTSTIAAHGTPVGTIRMLFITIGLAILISTIWKSLCITLHIDAQMAPQHMGANINEPKGGTATPRKEEGAIPEILVDEKLEYPSGWTTSVDDRSKTPVPQAFPMTGW